MAIDPLTALLNVGEKVLDKVLPDKMSEVERSQVHNAFTVAMLQEARKTDSEFRKFVLDYEGAAKDVPRIITITRSLIRPLFTILVGYLDWVYFTTGTTWTGEQTGLLKSINLIVLLFWFGERAVKNSGVLGILKKKGGDD